MNPIKKYLRIVEHWQVTTAQREEVSTGSRKVLFGGVLSLSFLFIFHIENNIYKDRGNKSKKSEAVTGEWRRFWVGHIPSKPTNHFPQEIFSLTWPAKTGFERRKPLLCRLEIWHKAVEIEEIGTEKPG